MISPALRAGRPASRKGSRGADTMGLGFSSVSADSWREGGGPPLASRLDSHAAVVVRGAAAAAEAEELASRVLAARESWTSDFGGEQFTLGRAFYTHLETGRARVYFENARAADALVESVLPGLQARSLDLLGRMLGGEVLRRAGFCGPGVHVFPAGGKVAREGGVVHFDLEGLTAHQKVHEQRTVSFVWMLRPALRGGGLRLWDALFDGRPDSEIEPDDHARVTVRTEAGDAVLFDGRRLHQICPFQGGGDRVSLTAHAVEVDRGAWEAWF